MKLKVSKGKILVGKVGKQTKQSQNMFVMPEVTDSLGIIKYVGEGVDPSFQVGTKVYYGKSRQEVRISGEDIFVMDEENIIAIVEDDNEQLEEQK